MHRLSIEERLSEFRRFSGFRMFNLKPYKRRRKVHFVPEGPCEICHYRLSTCQHHIVMLINGGSNKPWNRINICDHCHCSIHDWIKPREAKTVILEDELTKEFRSMFQNCVFWRVG